jgi:hypothetical protein
MKVIKEEEAALEQSERELKEQQQMYHEQFPSERR